MRTTEREEQRHSWRALARIVGQSTVRRLGKPLLFAYTVLFVLGVVVVVTSVVWMRVGR